MQSSFPSANIGHLDTQTPELKMVEGLRLLKFVIYKSPYPVKLSYPQKLLSASRGAINFATFPC